MRCPDGLQLVPALLLVALAIAPLASRALDLPLALNLHKPALRQRDDTIFAKNALPQRRVSEQIPVKVRKMSGDEGEMFLPEYWGFGAGIVDSSEVNLGKRKPMPRSLDDLIGRDTSKEWANSSIPQPLQAPFALHSNEHFNAQPIIGRLLRSPREIFSLDQRTFQCPGGTAACTTINRPNSCCPTGSSCESITDTGLGDVGCCGEGQQCGGQVADCPTTDATCPGSAGGGCCIPGYTCSGVGCAVSSTVTTTIQPVVTASPPQTSTPFTSSSTIQANAPVIPASPSSATDATTSISTFTAVTSITSTITASPSHTPTSSSSPITTHPTTTTSASPVLPLRPTSSTIPTTTTTAPPTTITASQCPTGFYQCSAYYNAGCCRVGRDCGLTSCPAQSSTLAINSDGVTVSVIPSGPGDAGLGASGCALGWFSCAAGQGGGCCPSGYACGTSCTATAVVVGGGKTGTAQVAKNNKAGRVQIAGWMTVGSIGMVYLLGIF